MDIAIVDSAYDAASLVFNSEDILTYIMSFLSEPEISGLRYVNPFFNKIGFPLAKAMGVEREKKISDIVLHYKPYNYNPLRRNSFVCFMGFVEDVLLTDWTILIRDLEFMESVFRTGTLLHSIRKSHPSFEENEYNSILDELRPYLYISNESYYTVVDLRAMASFKNIRGAYKMTRAQLHRRLRRPKDEVYLYVI